MKKQFLELHKLSLELAVQPLAEKLRAYADFFLDTVYGPWVDGSDLNSLDDFNFDLQILDCVTYVEVVLALVKTKPHLELVDFVREFTEVLRHIHYLDGIPNFLSRNHFMCVDWMVNNSNLLTDVTAQVSENIQIAEALINKPNWFAKHRIKPAADAKLPAAVVSNLAYIDTMDFLHSYQDLQPQFPDCSIVNIVRPSWDLTAQIGTHLNISHLGLVFNDRPAKTLLFYHATSVSKKVVKTTFFEYMTNQKDSPTIRGFNVLQIKPGYYNAG